MTQYVKLIVTEKWKAANADYDLLLTTDRETASKNEGAVFIHPFLTDKDVKKIEKRIDALKSNQHSQLSIFPSL
jgi:lichenan operon transcriptional antiterminator